MITVSVDSQPVLHALQKLGDSGRNQRPALLLIGERLVSSTKARFESRTGPDGKRWQSNTFATLMNYAASYGGSFQKKSGQLSKKGARRLASKRPLTGESLALKSTINYQLQGGELLVGSPMEYAAMQQFGGLKSEYPNLWGDIPARPFLGISPADENMISSTILAYLQQSLG